MLLFRDELGTSQPGETATGMTHDETQAQEELLVFNRFVRSSGLSILPHTVRHGDEKSDEPDIICQDADGAILMFELSELASGQTRGDLPHIQHRYDELGVLSPTEVETFEHRFSGLHFLVELPHDRTRRALRKICRYLISQKPEGLLPNTHDSQVLRYDSVSELKGLKGRITISRLSAGLTGPLWQVSSVTFFGDGIKEALQRKANKRYRYRCGAVSPQLLLYYEWDPSYMSGFGWECQPEHWRSLWESHFTAVWIFDDPSERTLKQYVSKSMQ